MTIIKFLTYSMIIAAAALLLDCSASENVSTPLSRVIRGNPIIPNDAELVCISEIVNRSTLTEIPPVLKSEIKKRFNTSGGLYFTEDIGSCHIILSITLLPMTSEPLSFNAAGLPERRRLKISALVTLIHAATGKEVLKNRETYAEYTYNVAGKDSISDFRGITGLTERLAERIISVVTTGWYKDTGRKRSGGID